MTVYPATPAKLREGGWGARVQHDQDDSVGPGDWITVTTRDGMSWDATIETVLWTGKDDRRQESYARISLVTTSRVPRTEQGGSRSSGQACPYCGDRLKYADEIEAGMCQRSIAGGVGHCQ